LYVPLGFSKASSELGDMLRGGAIVFCLLDLFYLLLDKVLAGAAYYRNGNRHRLGRCLHSKWVSIGARCWWWGPACMIFVLQPWGYTTFARHSALAWRGWSCSCGGYNACLVAGRAYSRFAGIVVVSGSCIRGLAVDGV
jgi:hypothetical protein